MKKIFTLVICVLATFMAQSQDLSGIVTDATERTPVENATVHLLTKDSTESSFFTITNNKGEFKLRKVPSGNYILKLSSVGYGVTFKKITIKEAGLDMGNIEISRSAETLSTVVIDGAPPVMQKGDTTVYSAGAYKVNPDANSEDLIKKMPGVIVDRSGNVTAQGEAVRKVTVDGRDFFGDDATATLRNLPADVIDKIQVFDKLSDQAQLTGFDDGNTTKSINIITKKDMRTGNFGRVYAGYGTDDRYNAGGNVSFFNNARRITVLGLTNNVNQQNFATQDLLGAMGGGGRGGRGGGGRRGGGDDFTVNNESGISKTNAIGLNYNDQLGEKIEISGSYFFNNSNTSNNTILRQTFIDKDTGQIYDETSVYQNENYNHRLNLRINYKIDSNNSLLFTSGLSFQNNTSKNFVEGKRFYDDNQLLSQTNNQIGRRGWGNNLNNNLLFRHAFPKRGRSVSVSFNTSFSNNNGDNSRYSTNAFYKSITFDTTNQYSDQNRNTNRYSVNLVYTEPLAEKTQLQINYNPSFQYSKADQQTYNFENVSGKYTKRDTSLSNVFDNNYHTQNAGITLRRGDRNNMVSAGLSYQHSELNSEQTFPYSANTSHVYSNLLGNAFARLKLSSKSHIRLSYRSSVSAPSVNQLQNVINTNNELFYSTGNPDLDQQYTHNLMARFNYNNTVTNQSFFGNIYVSTINNYITNATFRAAKDSALSNTVILREGSQLSTPVNLNGYFNARSFFTFSLPVHLIKSNLNFNTGISYAKQPGMVNRQLNISNAWNYNFGAAINSNISEYVDFSVSYSANINDVRNSIRPQLNNNYFTQSAGLTANLLTKKGTFFQNDITHQSYKGLGDGYNQSYWLWNMAVGQKFLKDQKGEIKLSVFDLLKENKSISRDVTVTDIEDRQSEVLQQYFLLTFTYKLKTFGKGKQSNNESERNRMFSPPNRGMHE